MHDLPATPDKGACPAEDSEEKGTLPADKQYWLGLDLNEGLAYIKANPLTDKSAIKGPPVYIQSLSPEPRAGASAGGFFFPCRNP